MDASSKKTETGRRSFLKSVLLASSAGAALSCAGGLLKTVESPAATSPARPTRRRGSTRERLLEYLQGLDIIDAHEHLVFERTRLARKVDVLTLLAQYVYVDMISAGYKTAPGEGLFSYNYLLDEKVPFERRWARAWPHLQNVKHGAYYRPAKIALKEFYGIEDLTDKNCREATERIRAANTPGLYRRVLVDKCRIKACLVQNGVVAGQDPADLFVPLMNSSLAAIGFFNKDFYNTMARMYGPVADFDTYVACVKRLMVETRAQGAVGVKIGAEPNVTPDIKAARSDFKEFLAGRPASPVLKSTVMEAIVGLAGEWDWPVAVHTGVWSDYRANDPKLMIDLIQRHPNVRFDLYHLGFPFTRDYIFIGKNFPNARLNLCWAWIVSPEITRQAIGEILDTVPVNKVTAFGGDYCWNVENVYGHLTMAREALAEAFAERIGRGHMGEEDARQILKLWLMENPRQLYGLKLA